MKYVCMKYVFVAITYSKNMDQPGKVDNRACTWSAEQGK